jgi:ABC-type polysaccharide/polyol phosphate export permease
MISVPRFTARLVPFVARDVREQFAGSRLGLAWTLLQPALLILLYWWVFAHVLQMRIPNRAVNDPDIPFLVFLLSALLPWFAFSEGINRSARAIISHRDVVTNLQFPLQIFPLSSVIAAFIPHLIGFTLFLAIFFIVQGQASVSQLLALGIILGLQLAATTGIALLLASLTVYLRDVLQILSVALMVLFYTAPIIYPMEMVPEAYRNWIRLNPFTPFAEAYHAIVLWGEWPEPGVFFHLIVFTLVCLYFGRRVFRHLQAGFADVM